MSALTDRLRKRPGRASVTLIALATAITAGFVSVGRGAPDVPTIAVSKGDFVDALELRGDIRPLKSIVLAAPMQSGELQIVKLAANGSQVKAGAVVVEFDSSTLRRTVQEKTSELKQADAEIEQAIAQARITEEQNATQLMKARYAVERAKLDVSRGDTIGRLELEQAKLALADTQHQWRELESKVQSDKIAADADLSTRREKRAKALFDLRRAERGLQNLQLEAPVDGIVNILTNYRASHSIFGGGEQEFRVGDRAWPGAQILELPDLSAVHLEARLEESDRSRLRVGQEGHVRIEAIPGKEFKARVERISLLSRVDFTGGYPPPRNFDLVFLLTENDPRIRPGMSAVARIGTDRVADVVLVPSEAIFQQEGHSVVYRLDGVEFEARPVQIARRGREQTIIAAGVSPGDRIATRRPEASLIRRVP